MWAGGGRIPGKGSSAAEAWGRGKNMVCSLSHCVGRGCAGWGALSGGGGWRSRWKPEGKGLRCLGEEFMLSPVGAGRLLGWLQWGNERIRFVFS